MGLDSYFYRSHISDYDYIIENFNKSIKLNYPDLYNKLNNLSLDDILHIMHITLLVSDKAEEVAYFRKWWNLNYFFNYDRGKYDSHIIVSKEQIITLRDIGLDLIKEEDFYIDDEDKELLVSQMNKILETTNWETDIITYNANW